MRFFPSLKDTVSHIIFILVTVVFIAGGYSFSLIAKKIRENHKEELTRHASLKIDNLHALLFERLTKGVNTEVASYSFLPGINSEFTVESSSDYFSVSEVTEAITAYLAGNQSADTHKITILTLREEVFFARFEFSGRGRPGKVVIWKVPVQHLLDSLAGNDPYIIQGFVSDQENVVLSGSDTTCFNQLPDISISNQGFQKFTCRDNGKNKRFLLFTQPLIEDLYLNLIFKDLKQFPAELTVLILVFLSLIAGIILLPYIERRKNQKQLKEINEVVLAASQKDFNKVLSEEYPGELGLLTRSLNKMSVQLKESYRDLEIRIIRRTSEISMRNAELRKKQREILQQNQELKSAYEALKESREKYEKLIEHLEDEYFFYSKALNDTLLFVSPSVKKILGYDVKTYRKKHNSIYTVNPINNIAREREGNLKSGVSQPKFLKEVFDSESREKILEVSEMPVFNDEGQLVSIEGLAHDITERQHAEDLIKEQEEKFRMLFTYASDFIFLYRLNLKNKQVGNIIEANNYTMNRLGYSIEELREMSPISLHAGDQVDEDPGNIKELVSHDSKFERTWQSKEGEIIHVEISIHAFRIKEKEVAIAVARDITQRKIAEEEIRFVNEELVNQKENLESLVDNLTETQEQLVQSEKMAALGQLIAGIAHEINTPLGAIKASIGNMVDSLNSALSELPELFQKQSAENLELFNNIFNLTRNRREELSSREKRQVRRDMTTLLRGHQIPDPDLIADALVYLEIYEISEDLLSGLKNSDALKVIRSARNFISIHKNTNTINLAVEKATKVVFALKKYAHRDSVGEKVSTDIADSIETVLTLYHNQLKQGVEIVRNYEKLPLIQCYQDEISQVWTNLLQNAIQAMHLEGKLTITAKVEGPYISISFKDTGPGIEPDIRDRIFEPFFTTKKQGEGSGLGLDIVKKIVEKHNGIIEVESKLGEGANFIVKLPLKNDTEEYEP